VTAYEDLSPYTHGGVDEGAAVRNVGWLEADRPFATGPVGSPLRQRVFVSRLRAAAAAPTGPMFVGTHRCGLCPTGGPAGSGEVRAMTGDGTVLAAPALVAHYVEAHGYRPPDEFVAAVCAGRTEVPDYQAGEEMGRYLPDEPLDDAHHAVAVRAIADRAMVWPEGVAARFAFFIAWRLVCERPGAIQAEGGGLPRMVIGLDRSGTRTFLTVGGYWDGTARHLAGIAAASMTEHTLEQLREAGWR
jgi:hypothetical protein